MSWFQHCSFYLKILDSFLICMFLCKTSKLSHPCQHLSSKNLTLWSWWFDPLTWIDFEFKPLLCLILPGFSLPSLPDFSSPFVFPLSSSPHVLGESLPSLPWPFSFFCSSLKCNNQNFPSAPWAVGVPSHVLIVHHLNPNFPACQSLYLRAKLCNTLTNTH